MSGVVERAEEVETELESRACDEIGVARGTFYALFAAFEKVGRIEYCEPDHPMLVGSKGSAGIHPAVGLIKGGVPWEYHLRRELDRAEARRLVAQFILDGCYGTSDYVDGKLVLTRSKLYEASK